MALGKLPPGKTIEIAEPRATTTALDAPAEADAEKLGAQGPPPTPAPQPFEYPADPARDIDPPPPSQPPAKHTDDVKEPEPTPPGSAGEAAAPNPVSTDPPDPSMGEDPLSAAAPAGAAPLTAASPAATAAEAPTPDLKQENTAAENAAAKSPAVQPTTQPDSQPPPEAMATHAAQTEDTGSLAAESGSASLQSALDTDQTLLTTTNIDRGLDWQYCREPEEPVPLSFEPLQGAETAVDADDASLLYQDQQAVFLGNVEIRHGDQLLEADEVHYDLEYETLDAQGNVNYERPGLRVTGSRAHFELKTSQGNMDSAEYRLPDRSGRGNASTADIDGEDLSHYTDLSYTTCPPGNNDWLLRAKRFDADQSSGRGVAHHATLSFRDVPVAYVPYLSFPIDDRRHSGFLAPTFGNTDSTGLDLSIPYYFNIAPEMDATFTPRVMSKRGLLLGGEFRYLAENHHTELRGEILPDDRDAREDENSRRGALSWQAGGKPATRWSYDIDVNYASDDNYLNDLSESFALTSARHLERRGDLRYTGNDWSFLSRLQHYQTIDQTIDTADRPYSRLPQLLLQLDKPDQAMGLTYHLDSEYVYFDKNDDDTVTGHRVDLNPGLSLPMRRSWGYLTPKASLRYTKYQLNDQIAGEANNPDRTLPTFSLDSGLIFERDDSWFGKSVTQTLEPRLFYLFTPNTNQEDLPDFDTSNVDFSFANIFRENRFSGADRVGDANQLTTALTSRMYGNESGQELLRGSFGQIFYFRDRKVQLDAQQDESDTDNSSSLVAEVAAQPHKSLRTRAGIQWNPYESGGKTEKGAASIQYSDDQKRLVNLGYRYDQELFEQTDVSFRWPITHKLHGVGRWNYSLKYDQTQAAFAGFEYESCCWIARLVAQQLRVNSNDNDDSELQNSIFLQVELKGLTAIGDKVDQYLERAIPGYEYD